MASAHISAGALFNVNGVVAVVTGGGSGIGLMITKVLAANGAKKVYIVGRRKEVLEEAAQNTDSDVVVPLVGDVTSCESLLQLAERVEADTGYINLVVANAGIMGSRPLKSAPNEPPPSISEYRAHALMAVNATEVYYITLAFLNLLDAGNKQANTGRDWRSQVIATSSIAGYSRLNGAPFAYNSSKAAVTHMMKMMATAFVPYNIRCNVLAPGIFPSDLASGIINNLGQGAGGKADHSFIPTQRPGNEEDIAGAILYLASNAGAYLNGSVLVVDGGRLATLPSTY